ncbi:MAG: hypothetical protein ACRDBX_02955, partial [Erysipelotrichaceae bacterium]
VIQVPSRVLQTIAPILEWLATRFHQKPLFTSYSMVVLQSNGCFSHAKAAAILQHTNRPFEETIHDMIVFSKSLQPNP